MTEWVLVFVDDATPPGIPSEFRPQDGQYLADYDHGAREGRGLASWTSDVRHALRWASFKDAMDVWQSISPTLPVRDDGKPNRPLTAYGVEPRKL